MKRCWISILSLMALPTTDFMFCVGDAPADAGRFEVPEGFYRRNREENKQ